MEEKIVTLIAEAEETAAGKRAQAEARAQVIAAQSDRDCAGILRASEESCRKVRAEILARAREEAEAAYEKAIAESGERARAYADEALSRADATVADVVGRLTK